MGREISEKLEVNQDLFPYGWYSKKNYVAKANILAEAIKNQCLIKETSGYLNMIEDVRGKMNKEEINRMEKSEKYLPIGTVVMLNGGKKRVMITGFCAIENGDKSKIWDYSGCVYPEGFLSSAQTCIFNHDQIEKIYHLGLADDEEEKKFKDKLKELTKSM